MPLTVLLNNCYNIICFQGAYNISSIPQLTPQLTTYFQEQSQKDLVIDLSGATSIDSSVIRIFLNLKKRIESSNNRFFILKPSEDIMNLLIDSNLSKILTIISDTNELQRIMDKYSYDRYLPFTFNEKGLLRIRCSCGACGSGNVTGYLMSPADYKWKWRSGDIFPYCENKNNVIIDYFSALPVVCTDCLMASTDLSLFNVIDDHNTIHYKSILDDRTKILLSKATKKRRKMMEDGGIITEFFFQFPRNRTVSFLAYQLSEACTKAVSVNKGSSDSFNIGFLNFISLMYASDSFTDELMSNCRTWLTQALAEPSSYSKLQLAQTYYILMTVSLKIEKFKDASKYFADFTSLIDLMPEKNKETNEINSPVFWYTKAESIWQKEIDKKSTALKV